MRRSTKNIILAAQMVINDDSKKKDKDLRKNMVPMKGKGELSLVYRFHADNAVLLHKGPPPRILSFKDSDEEGKLSNIFGIKI